MKLTDDFRQGLNALVGYLGVDPVLASLEDELAASEKHSTELRLAIERVERMRPPSGIPKRILRNLVNGVARVVGIPNRARS